jgi:hypothetical protein
MNLKKQMENNECIMIGMGVFAGFLSSLCCVGPLIFTILGVSGVAVLSRFDILRIPLVVLVVALFVLVGFFLYKKRNTCGPGAICSDLKKCRKLLIAYWIGLIIAVLGVALPNLISAFF